MIGPDYPGFGESDFPSPVEYQYTFDNIANTIDGLLEKVPITSKIRKAIYCEWEEYWLHKSNKFFYIYFCFLRDPIIVIPIVKKSNELPVGVILIQENGRIKNC